MNEEPKTPRTIRLAYLLIFSMAAVIITIGVVIVNWSYQSSNVLDITEPIPVNGEAIARNSIIVLDITYCKHIDAKGTVERKLVGERAEYLFPTVKDTTGEGCSQTSSPTLLPLLPAGATPGKYHIEYKVTYDINPLKKGVVEEFKTEDFKVE